MLARVCLLASVALVTAAVAGAASVPAVTVGPGDSISVKGSNLVCVVSTGTPRSIACGISSKTSVLAHSYAISMADRGAAIYAATGSQQVVARDLNPPLLGSTLPSSTHKSTDYLVATYEHILVGGTHIECAPVLIDGGPRQAVGCGIMDSPSGYFVEGTYAATLSDQSAGITRAGADGAQTVVAIRDEP